MISAYSIVLAEKRREWQLESWLPVIVMYNTLDCNLRYACKIVSIGDDKIQSEQIYYFKDLPNVDNFFDAFTIGFKMGYTQGSKDNR